MRELTPRMRASVVLSNSRPASVPGSGSTFRSVTCAHCVPGLPLIPRRKLASPLRNCLGKWPCFGLWPSSFRLDPTRSMLSPAVTTLRRIPLLGRASRPLEDSAVYFPHILRGSGFSASRPILTTFPASGILSQTRLAVVSTLHLLDLLLPTRSQSPGGSSLTSRDRLTAPLLP